ncbi:unnamed protein product [Adineta steineri]|uniref:G-protein coupled receptors family 1 profile domain-containing protein n=1 Tax=Adineta steineri TaxID=433720 RepID=A0A819LT23_9BILA|nr:unnamed protein product [Adineta steineri]CAF0940483.1 unnamed protein product [Adineta steineri]CAF1498213.1 unnamed protein product [Adineta steineri]CAF3955124.1 unnamed protein product [Adineta steineri]CAF3969444.1 unnamed protein product [Adineta steineri]
MPNATTTLKIASRCLNYVGAIPFIVLGIVGAILTVIIFTKQRLFWHNASITYLLAGATVTGIHLPIIYTQSILVHGFDLGVFNTNERACREHNYLLYMTTVAAISFPCWAAFDQYVITSRNAGFRNRWSSIRVARWAIVGTVIFWTIVYLPIIFVSGIVDGSCVLKDGTFTLFNTYFLTPFVYSVGPLTIMTVFTLGTIRNLRSAHSFRQQSHIARQVRRMLIPQLIVLGVSGIPFGFQGIYLQLTNGIKKDSFRLALEDFFGQVILLLFHCNYVCTFYIYFYTSSEVRKAFKDLIFKCIRRNNVAPIDTTAHTNTHDQTLNIVGR